jgi:hypothetical protein
MRTFSNTSFYKETSKYPDGIKVTHSKILDNVVPHISSQNKSLPRLFLDFEIPENISKPTIAIEVDKNGIIVDSLSILPFS